MTKLTTIDDLSIQPGARVLLRVDFNVPMEGEQVTDASRIMRALPTIEKLCDLGAKVVLLSHFGRPKGKQDVAYSLSKLYGYVRDVLAPRSVLFCDALVGAEAEARVAALQPGEILLLENTRFDAREEKNDPAFAAALARLGDYYVNDAFSCAHRAHASTVGIADFLPSAAGLLLEQEVGELEKLLSTPEQPCMAIVGGAKVSTKMELLEALLAKVSILAIGGAMANTFLKAQGVEVGASLYEPSYTALAQNLLEQAKAQHVTLLLPEDVVVAKSLQPHAPSRICAIAEIQPDEMILDLGPASIAAMTDAMATARTILWNGPVGAFEIPPFDQGTVAIAKKVAEYTKKGYIKSVAGGGDSVAAIKQAGVNETDVTYLSTAGGAFLEWLEGKTLPGLVCILSHSASITPYHHVI